MNLLTSLQGLFHPRKAKTAPRPSVRPHLEVLEDRATPATLTWVGPEGGLWSDPDNWDAQFLPQAGDMLVFGGTTGAANTSSFDDIPDLTVEDIRMNPEFTGTINIIELRLNVTHNFIAEGGNIRIADLSLSLDQVPAGVDVGNLFYIGLGRNLVTDSQAEGITFSAADLVMMPASKWLVTGILQGTSFTGHVEQDGTLDFTPMIGLNVFGSYHVQPLGVINMPGGDSLQLNSVTSMIVGGTINMQGSSINSPSGVLLDVGTLNVNVGGVILGDLYNSGTVHLLDASDDLFQNTVLNVTGNYDQFVGSLVMPVGGLLNVQGRVTIREGSTLIVTADQEIPPGAAFVLIQAFGGGSGGFQTVILPPPPEGTVWVHGWVSTPGEPGRYILASVFP